MSSTATSQFYEQAHLCCVACGCRVVYTPGAACKRCQTPLEVSRSINRRETKSHFVTVLGASGAGKTVYLGMLLDMLSRGCGNVTGIPSGAFSVAVQQQTISALEQRRFPDKTPNEADQWNWVHCEARDSARPNDCFDIITPDFAGEAIAMEIDKPGSCPTVAHCLQNASGVITLFDSESVRDNGRTEDLFGIKLMTYLANIQAERQPAKGKFEMPVAVVMTKADNCPEATSSAVDFISSNMPGTIQVCREKFSKRSLFSASVVGCTTTSADSTGAPIEIPLHIQPQGVLEPLQWIMESLK